MKVAISSGHGKHIRGASGYIDEVNNARLVVERVAELLDRRGIETDSWHDNISDDQSENLNRIVDWHNSQTRDLDISVHFNAYEPTEQPMGTEVLYVSQEALAIRLSAAIAAAGNLIDRGGKYRSDLYFLNQTEEPAVLLEICFVDSQTDATAYQNNFQHICQAIADVITEGI